MHKLVNMRIPLRLRYSVWQSQRLIIDVSPLLSREGLLPKHDQYFKVELQYVTGRYIYQTSQVSPRTLHASEHIWSRKRFARALDLFI